MAGHRMAGLAAAVAAGAILAGCSVGGAVRQAPNPVSGRPPVELTRMDAATVAIFNAAVPYNAGTAGASAQDQIGRNRRAGPGAPTAPGGTGPGTGTGLGGSVQPQAGRTGGGTGMTTTGTATPGSATGTATNRGPAGTAGTGTGSGATGTGTAPATTPPTTPTTGANPGVVAAPGTASGTAGGTAATGSEQGSAASPGVTSRLTPSTGAGVDWTRIQGDYRTVTSTWGAVRNTVKGQGANAELLAAVDAAVRSLGSAIASRDAMGTALAANDLTAYTTPLLGLYRPGTPVQIYQLEYLAREVQLDTESGNAEGALDGARSMGGVWASLRMVAMARNKAHAGAVDGDVGRLAHDVASGANLNLRSDAATLLRDLQTLTRDFLSATS